MARVLIIASEAESLLNFRGELIRSIQVRGHSVSAIAPTPYPALMERLGAAGIDFVPVAMKRNGMNPFHDVVACYALYCAIRRLRPDCVLAYTIKPVIYGMLASRLCRIRARYALITGLGYAFTDSNPSLRRNTARMVLSLLYRVALKQVAAVIFQNTDDQKFFCERRLIASPVPTHRVYGSGVNIREFTPVPLPETPIFLMIARLLWDKGVGEYIAAARQLKARMPNAVCQLAGAFDSNPSAVSSSELQAWVNEGVIDYLGVLRDVRPAIAGASVFVLPSYREGTPRAVLEAMAMARPVITTNVAGCRETVVHGESGLLVPPYDADALVSAMLQLATDHTTRKIMGDAGRVRAETYYDVDSVNAAMRTIMGLN